MMKQLTILILMFFITQISLAQVSVSGTVKDEKGPVSYVSVVLKDSTQMIRAYDITDEQGAFEISTMKGNYTLEISLLSYDTWTKAIDLQDDLKLEDIVMSINAQNLDEVVVKYKVPLIEQKTDRVVFNVANSIAARGGNALDALRAAPGLQVESNSVGLLGRGAAGVMINGRILQLSGEELVNFLNSIASDDIKKIEIIENPPARYEARGNGGLINLVYKKGIRESWRNSTTLSYSKNTYDILTLRNNFLYNKNRVRSSLSLNGDLGAIRELESVQTDYPSGPWVSNLNAKQQRDNFSGRFAIDYDLSRKTSVGFQYLGNFGQPDKTDNSITDIFNANNVVDSIFDSSGSNDRSSNSQVYNVHLVSSLDTLGRVISFDLDYFDYDNKLERNYVVNTLAPNKDFMSTNQDATNISNQAIDNYSAKVDVEHPLKRLNLSYGAKISFTKTINDLRTFNNITGTPILEPGQSDEFEYEENVQAAYVNGSGRLSEKLDMQIGLRLENTITKGFSKTVNEVNENDYLKLFPTFYLSYNPNQLNNIRFNYGRRINRPGFRDLNPFRFFTNSNSYSEGNPFIQPSFSDNFNFSFTHKRKYMTNIYFNRTTDGFGIIFDADEETNIQAIIRKNYFTDYRAGIGQGVIVDHIPWLFSQNQVYLIGYDSEFDADVDATPEFGMQFYAATYNSITLSRSTSLQVDFFYESPFTSGLYDFSERYGLDIGLRQNFLDRKLQVALYVQDIFDTGSLRSLASEVNGVKVDFGSNYSRRFLRLSMTYNFGNNKINVRDRSFGNNDERNRAN